MQGVVGNRRHHAGSERRRLSAIEPLIAIGGSRTVTLKDGWTIHTRDRSVSAHHEHTVFVTATGAQLLTA